MARSSSRKRRCTAKTKAGTRCKAAPLKDGALCLAHATRNDEVSLGFGGPQEGSGRPPLPRPHALMRERLEQRVDEVIAPYFDAISGAVVVAKFEGEVHVSDVADYGARIAAAERLLDRVYGKPRQAVDVEGVSETPPPLIQIVAGDDSEVSDAAREFLRRLLPKP